MFLRLLQLVDVSPLHDFVHLVAVSPRVASERLQAFIWAALHRNASLGCARENLWRWGETRAALAVTRETAL